MSVSNILGRKDGAPAEIVSVGSDTDVVSAVELMSKNRIGAVLVMDDGAVRGILSERDVMHLIAKRGVEALSSAVSDVMTKDPVTCGKTDSVDQAMSVMTEGRFRHLPVVDGDRLIGMISIGDVVKRKIEEAEHEVEDLKGYITN